MTAVYFCIAYLRDVFEGLPGKIDSPFDNDPPDFPFKGHAYAVAVAQFDLNAANIWYLSGQNIRAAKNDTDYYHEVK